VIGEAARQVSDGTMRTASEIPWQLIIGMRNVLAHDYGAVDVERIYRVVAEDLSPLLGRLEQLIAALEREVDWTDDNKT
jgi:uncharacterized protein with HEPN domain